MTLTLGAGPFSPASASFVNVERPRAFLLFEESPKRIRATLGGETIVDSRRAKLLHESGHLPVYYFPEGDVRMDLLELTDHRTHCPHKGDASYWTIRVGATVAEKGAWTYPTPLEGAPPLDGYLAFYWQKLDGWWEEDEQVFGHARDPYHRIDILPSSRRIRISLSDETIAESARATALFETGLPTRWYLPREDVRTELLVPSDTHTGCAYKGLASYESLHFGDAVVDDLAWYYPDPTREAEPIRELLCFLNEKVDLEIDGELQERPQTPWS